MLGIRVDELRLDDARRRRRDADRDTVDDRVARGEVVELRPPWPPELEVEVRAVASRDAHQARRAGELRGCEQVRAARRHGLDVGEPAELGPVPVHVMARLGAVPYCERIAVLALAARAGELPVVHASVLA